MNASLMNKLRNAKRSYIGQIIASDSPSVTSHEVVDVDTQFSFPIVNSSRAAPEAHASRDMEVDPHGKKNPEIPQNPLKGPSVPP